MVNPFYSLKTRRDIELQMSRPAGLPEQSPGSENPPIRDGCTGKGRGGSTAALGTFETPPSKLQGHVPGGGKALGAKRSEGLMPDDRVEPVSAVRVETRGQQPVDELQRSLEIEVVNHLREQNTKLLQELEWFREQQREQQRSSDSGLGSSTSWVEVATGDGEKRVDAARGDGGFSSLECKTPRGGDRMVGLGSHSRFTPNGTRVPDGTPPRDEPRVEPRVFKPPAPPAVPPFPPSLLQEHDMEKFMDGYEKVEKHAGMLKTDACWEPPKEFSPHEARAFWLEREVIQLRQSLDRVTKGSSFKSSEYWSKGFHPPTGPPVTDQYAGYPTSPVDGMRSDPNLAECISRANPGDVHGQSLGGSGDVHLQAQAGMCSRDGVEPRHLRGGSGDHSPRDRARMSIVAGEVQGQLRGGSGVHHAQDRARMVSESMHHEYPGHLLGGCGAECHQARALHGDHGLFPGVRAPASLGLHPDGDHRSCLEPRHGGGGGAGGGLDQIPSSWENGGGISGSKADLPELPGTASPLQFGDWVHLCGPVMRDLSSMASRWWDLAVRQAQVHYSDWKHDPSSKSSDQSHGAR